MDGKEVMWPNGPEEEKPEATETQSCGLILPSTQTTLCVTPLSPLSVKLMDELTFSNLMSCEMPIK